MEAGAARGVVGARLLVVEVDVLPAQVLQQGESGFLDDTALGSDYAG